MLRLRKGTSQPLGEVLWEVWVSDVCPSLLVTSPRGCEELGVSSMCAACAGGRTLGMSPINFPTSWLRCLEYRSRVTGFKISHKGLVHALLNQVFLGRRRVWGYLFHHLADITSKRMFYHASCKWPLIHTHTALAHRNSPSSAGGVRSSHREEAENSFFLPRVLRAEGGFCWHPRLDDLRYSRGTVSDSHVPWHLPVTVFGLPNHTQTFSLAESNLASYQEM